MMVIDGDGMVGYMIVLLWSSGKTKFSILQIESLCFAAWNDFYIGAIILLHMSSLRRMLVATLLNYNFLAHIGELVFTCKLMIFSIR
ncbi:hypothetical protein FEM48_Zijuj04G0046000 [Ziziphus jujuba var. spinosa]|uniref:Uncharacterized protein n=1 Tax=Ziziphus jujuba var. spinosa TaxID=714518 RepID=A0A978VHU4_ZIZJJ|nr:hypothetical protein FEM48_Zijuj04G0046000 [Ziziphus jujuba var. spinosa]